MVLFFVGETFEGRFSYMLLYGNMGDGYEEKR